MVASESLVSESARGAALTDTDPTSTAGSAPSLSRIEKALAFVDRNGLGLEIGPAHSPIAPRSGGFNVQVLDYLDTDSLRRKFQDIDGADVANIEEVDFVWKGERLPSLVGGSGRFDWIIASHVIEHLPDLTGFLMDCQEVLRPGGVISLIIPDKRYCFDRFRPLSTTGELLDAYEQRRSRPSPGAVFDHFANCITVDGQNTWSADTVGEIAIPYSFEIAQDSWKHASAGEYVDVHVSCFTPASFSLIVQDLRSLGFLRLEVIHEFETTGMEFFVTLGEATAPVSADEQVTLLRRIDRELADVTKADALDGEYPMSAGPSLEVSAREEGLILFKRRVVEKIGRVMRRGSDHQGGNGSGSSSLHRSRVLSRDRWSHG